MQRRHKDLHGAEREIAASITRLVRSETRDLVGRPCVPTPVVPLNNTTQLRVHLCMRMVCPVRIALRIIRETRDFRFNSNDCVTVPSPRAAPRRRERFKRPETFRPLSHFCPHATAALEEGRGIAKFSFRQMVRGPQSHTSRHNKTDKLIFISRSALARLFS